jgi:hypothetical protein
MSDTEAGMSEAKAVQEAEKVEAEVKVDAAPPAPEKKKKSEDPQSVWREHHDRIQRIEERLAREEKPTRGLMAWLREDAK